MCRYNVCAVCTVTLVAGDAAGRTHCFAFLLLIAMLAFYFFSSLALF